MSIVSHLHHFFHAETCHPEITAAERSARNVPAVRASTSAPAYHAQPGLKRYRCKERGCKRTFNDLTGTLLDGSKRSVMHWILATFLLCLSSSRRIARELRRSCRTGYRWCWWLRNAALSMRSGGSWPDGRSRRPLSHRRTQGTGQDGREKALGRCSRGASQEA